MFKLGMLICLILSVSLAAVYTDNFNHADTTRLVPPWVVNSANLGSYLAISNNQAVAGGEAFSNMIYNNTTSVNQFTQMEYVGGFFMLLYVRYSQSALTGYRASYNNNNNQVIISRLNAGVETELIPWPYITATISPGSIFGMCAIGDSIKVSIDGVQIGSVYDATIASGYVGIGGYAYGTTVDNWRGGDTGSITPTCDSNLTTPDTIKSWATKLSLTDSVFCDSGKIVLEWDTIATFTAPHRDSILHKANFKWKDTISNLKPSDSIWYKFYFAADTGTAKDTTITKIAFTSDSIDTSIVWTGSKIFDSLVSNGTYVQSDTNWCNYMRIRAGDVATFSYPIIVRDSVIYSPTSTIVSNVGSKIISTPGYPLTMKIGNKRGTPQVIKRGSTIIWK